MEARIPFLADLAEPEPEAAASLGSIITGSTVNRDKDKSAILASGFFALFFLPRRRSLRGVKQVIHRLVDVLTIGRGCPGLGTTRGRK